jgi:hypothetical protein
MSSTPIWITPAGLLTTASELTFTSISVLASGTNVKYSLIGGSLPPGLNFSSVGRITGSPASVSSTVRSEFTVRARNFPYYSDRTFFIDVEGTLGIRWETASGFLSVGYNQEPYAMNKQWVSVAAVAVSKNSELQYSISGGALPAGLTLGQDGNITGYIDDEFPDGLPKIYEFTVTASINNLSSSRTFKIAVIHPDMLRADSELYDWVFETFTADNMVASISYLQPLQFINGSDLGTLTPSTDAVNISVEAYDAAPEKGPVSYKLINGYLPDGLVLNSSTGHIEGYAKRTTEYTENYQISVAATKTDVESSATVITTHPFDIKLTGRFESPLIWITLSDLGSIEKGTISELFVLAQEQGVSTGIRYSLIGGELPMGLTLRHDGTLTGRISYDTNTADYSFTIRATNQFKSRTIERTFTLSVTAANNRKYSEIYFRPFLPVEKRAAYSEFITNEEIFVPSSMYRYHDSNFGVQRNLKMTLEFGLEQLYQEEYYYALMENFYRKRLHLGSVKVAQGRDPNGEHLYDIIYAEVIDELVNNNGISVSNIIVYPWTRNEVYYPASIDNMRTQLKSITLIDYATISVNDQLKPKYMSTPGTTYISTVPICYTLPGQSAEIVRRIKRSGFKFNSVDFEIDRLVVGNTLDNTEDKYVRFDRQSLGDLVDTDSYIQGPEGWIRLDDENDQPLLRE